MLKHRRIGDAELFLVSEFSGPTHDRDWMLPETTFDGMRTHEALLADRFWLPRTDRLVFTMQLMVLKTAGRVIVIDTGVGNRKPRKAGWQDRLNTPTLDWLAGIGAGRDHVTDVVHTHLHGDHIGWNTLDDGLGWEPTFRRAVYHLPAVDYDAFKARYDGGQRDLFDGGFADSVLPIVNAGLARFMSPGETVCETLEVRDAAGHSPGQVCLCFQGDGEEIVFAADVFHSPVQVYQPQVNSRWCELPELARQTRLDLLEYAASHGATLMPAHSSAVGGWQISRAPSGFAVLIHD